MGKIINFEDIRRQRLQQVVTPEGATRLEVEAYEYNMLKFDFNEDIDELKESNPNKSKVRLRLKECEVIQLDSVRGSIE